MLLERLTVRDVGVFRGEHSFDLAPRQKYGQQRPVILFGGLNGAGKTTILTAVRVALYGRHALGYALSTRDYEDTLRNLIHRDPTSLVPTTQSQISLEFAHARLTGKHKYRIVRTWEDAGRRINETLRIYRDGEEVPGLTMEQAQAFLGQLIPQGISQFFFFDGEKIAALAKDENDSVLADSLRKLLGLDVVERLKSDLTILLRQRRADASGSAKTEYEALEVELTKLEQEVTSGLDYVSRDLNPRIDAARGRAAKLNADLAERGGAWAVNRESLTTTSDQLNEARKATEDDLRTHLAGILPIALAPKLCRQLSQQLDAEADIERATIAKTMLEEKTATIRTRLRKKIPKPYWQTIDSVLDSLTADKTLRQRVPQKLLHPVGQAERNRLLIRLSADLPERLAACRRDASRLKQIDEKLSNLATKLSQAPSDGALDESFHALQAAGEEIGRLIQTKRAFIEELRRKTWLSIDLTRKLRRIEEDINKSKTSTDAYARAEQTRAVLDEFGQAATHAKLEALRKHFIKASKVLARKEDMVLDAAIDPQTFAVRLIGRKGEVLNKSQLSAGEKQIYAIAMLDALARTSGRLLPVIIDTPLGRLDSRHRTKLVENYFPRASHQVIILSTDTEVDEPFYQGLSRYISHAYHLVFDDQERATRVEEGYFWRQRTEDSIRAA